MKRFRITVILWVFAIFATALSAYNPATGVIAACVMIGFWWIIIRWHEDEESAIKIAVVLVITLRILEPFAPREPDRFRIISLGLFILFSILPVWRKRESWYDRYL